MFTKFTIIILLIAGLLTAASKPDYLNKNLSIDERLDDLMQRMSLKDKVAQMCQYVGLEHQRQAAKMRFGEDVAANDAHAFYKSLSPADIEKMVERGEVGSFLHVLTAKEANELQGLAQKSPLKIPLLMGIDAIHGNGLVSGATIYPTPLTLASSWDPQLIKKIGQETALEMRAMGMHWAFTPNVDVARDARWGRMGETFGEDPLLVAEMGSAMIKGLQEGNGDSLKDVIACAKHFVGGGQSVNGLNSAPTDVSRSTLYQIFFPPFQAAINAGAYTIMAAHNEIEGQPCHGSRFLLTDILRQRMGFSGFVVSDWMDIERLYSLHHVAADMKDAYRIAVDAGIDMHMHGPDFAEKVIALVKEGKVPQKRIDEAVRAILKAKFMLGLFEHPYVDENEAQKIMFSNNHQKTALQAARESIVLLKNNGILPLTTEKKMKIFVSGPNADNQTILGDWVLKQPDERVITVLEGLRKTAGKKAEISYYDCGQNIWKMEDDRIDEAAQKAAAADVNIMIVGGNSLRYLYGVKTSGENTDRAHINLAGKQLELLKKIYKTGKPLIVVFINGRALGEPWIEEHADAVIEGWEPGSFGGQALAEIIFGKVNPSGKLPVTIPRDEGQILMTYNHKPSAYFHKYMDEPDKPLYPFGFGLSYSSFKISDVKLSRDKISVKDTLTVSLKIKNTGKMAGKETVQMYLRDEVSSLTRPVMELKRFSKVALKKGEEKTINFKLSADDLGFYNEKGEFLIESGAFTLFIGTSSADPDMKTVKFELL